MEKEINYSSRYSLSFYFSFVFLTGVLGLSLYQLIAGRLDLWSLFVLNLLSLLSAWFLSFRFDCRIQLDSKRLKVSYFSPFNKKIEINTDQIIEFDKHPDYSKRYHKKIFIKTLRESYLIRYNISDSSDDEFLEDLSKLVPAV